MYDICHPSYYYIAKLGCNNPVKVSTAFYVYIELCEVKRFWHVDYKYNDELDLIYLEAKKNKNSNIEIYIPWPVSFSITIELIEEIQQTIQTEQLIFVFKAADSTSVCYKVSAGLVKPITPELTKQLKEKEEKKTLLEKNIRKNTSNLYELAKTLSSGNRSAEFTENRENENDLSNTASTSTIQI